MSEATLSPEDILVRAQDTPNPNALKFVTNQMLRTEGKVTLKADDERAKEVSELVKTILEIPGVTQLYLFQNTATVTHEGELPNDIVKEQTVAALKTRLPVHNPNFLWDDEERAKAAQQAAKAEKRSQRSPDIQKIEEILDRTVRPGLQADGGDIEIISFEDDTVKILYQGACGGCPSSLMGTLDAIQSILGHELDNPNIRVLPV